MESPPSDATIKVIRHTVWRPILSGVLGVGGCVAGWWFVTAYANPSKWLWWGLTVLAGLLALLLGRVVWRMLVATLRPSNWLLAVSSEALFVKFRSYLNWHFDGAEAVVVYVPFSEISSMHKTTCRTDTPDVGRRIIRYHRYLDLHLNHEETELLREAIVRERTQRLGRGWRWRHVPVTVPKPNLLRIEWLGRSMLAALEGFVKTDPALKYKAEEGGSQEDILRRLEQGHTMDAIRLAQIRYAMSLAEAKKFVEQLQQYINDEARMRNDESMTNEE
jgi:hypothetical protein